MTELINLTALQLTKLIREKSIGIEELVLAYLKRIRRYDGSAGLNSIAKLDGEILEKARRMDNSKPREDQAIYGLPVLVKDNIDVSGFHTTAGSLALADNMAYRDAPIISNLRRNGALILGKTNMTEFANYTSDKMPNGYSSRAGQVKNAYNKGISPGGSSSGSAVAVSAGFCGAALGTDTSFSIVGCATENGVTGFKPAHGILSSEGIIPIARTLDSAGPITRDLTDTLLVYSCMRDKKPQTINPIKPSDISLAVNIFNKEQVSVNQLKKYDALLETLKQDGVKISEVNHEYNPYMKVIMKCEFFPHLEGYLSSSEAPFRSLKEIVTVYESNPEMMMKFGISYLSSALNCGSDMSNNEEYFCAMKEREKSITYLSEDLNNFDACLMTGPTNIMHYCGLPSLALRLGMSDDGTPRGAILYGADERRLLGASMTIEKYCGIVTPPILI